MAQNYLFIAILCVKMSRVNKVLEFFFSMFGDSDITAAWVLDGFLQLNKINFSVRFLLLMTYTGLNIFYDSSFEYCYIVSLEYLLLFRLYLLY